MTEAPREPATRFASMRARADGDWEPLDWWRLEARAWYGAPEVRRALAFLAPPTVFRDLAADSVRHPLVAVVMLVWNIAGVTAPAVGAFFLVGWLFSADKTGPLADAAPLAAAGVAFAAGALPAGIGLITDRDRTSGVDAGSAHAIGWVHALSAGIALVAAVVALALGHVDGAWGIVPIVIDLVVGVLHFTMYRRQPFDASTRWKQAVDRVAIAVAALDEETRARSIDDLRAAIGELESAGIVDEATAASARTTPPGLLGARFAPRAR
ncbi:hypothetical protein [Microbacterium radiodurans]|uniref:Uncharacterized protein n=1 Tax=Microbacterium radiodurans TaxID=661398 RepID=A0A5J5IV27_9MICO|nr:hypothetical protein [Microbacterium radiodurans]KAA9089041.1 hypothetical protein F6B42_00595 [Microbacterium radiodurans]